MPFVGNTHTGSSVTGSMMSEGYEKARQVLKQHVHPSAQDVLLFCGSGMTDAVHKLQPILGLRNPERIHHYATKKKQMPLFGCNRLSHRGLYFLYHYGTPQQPHFLAEPPGNKDFPLEKI